MEEITKHINDTNASYRHVGAGNAKNTDLFLDNEHYELFRDCGEQITVRFNKTNLTQAILFIASILPRKFDQSANHYIVNYSDEFVINQLAILDALFKKDSVSVNSITQTWNIRKDILKNNGEIDNRFYFNNLLREVEYRDYSGKVQTTKFTIRNYFAGGFSNLNIKKASDGIFDIKIDNVTEPYNDGKEDGLEEFSTQLIESYDNFTLQQVFYGAPGTGKSHCVKCETRECEKKGRAVRTTFHPDSDYSTFVGAYKPTMEYMPLRNNLGQIIGKDGKYLAAGQQYEIEEVVTERQITYDFVPQAFLQAYIDAWKNREEPEYLIIEEINRGNCAQIFGDLFQLLDRGCDGYSEYAVRADKDLQKHLCKALADAEIEDYPKVKSGEELILPKNLYIRATMNTSDQSLFPIDSAFKRRWDWKYVPIAKGSENGTELNWVIDVDGTKYDWWTFISTINKHVFETTNSEDKQLGFFFCKAKDNVINAETFVGKVIFYLWNDVFKDFGFDNPIFADKEDTTNPKLSFDKFYLSNGLVNIEKVKAFFANIGIEPNITDDTDDIDTNGKKDYSKYSVNGKGKYGKNEAINVVMQKFVDMNPNYTVEDVVAEWRRTFQNVDIKHLVETQSEYEERIRESKDKTPRAKKVEWNDKVVFTSTQVALSNFSDFLRTVNDTDWDIKIERVD